MASVAQLNVEIAARIDGLRKGLASAEREMRRSGGRLSNLGTQLTQTISLGLGAFAVGAIKTAGEFESLKLAMRTTFETAGRSASDADSEINKLRKSALAPGLDFEQAIKGSIRLQGVGTSAENARATIEQLANAIAMTGGTAQNLDSVTVQFSQMIAKGKVMASDLRIVQENMPVITKLMQQAFGTSNSENLQALGITGKEFVDKITAEMEKLPRVSGGISNALVNMAASSKQFLSVIGESLVKAFNIGANAENFSAWLTDVANSFTSLSSGTQKAIAYVGAFAIAIGPVIKVLGTVKLSIASVYGTMGSLLGITKSVGGVFLSAVSSVNAFRIATLALTGGVVAILAGIAATVYLMRDNFDAAKVATEAFNTATETTIQQAAKETAVLNQNFAVLKSVHSTTQDRKKAIDNLKEAYPQYLKNLDLEHASLQQLERIQKGVNDQILRGIAERQKAAAVNAIYEKQAAILLRIEQIRRTRNVSTAEASLIDTGDMIKAGSIADAVITKMQQQIDDLGKQANVTAKDFDNAFGLQTRAINTEANAEYAARQAYYDNHEWTNKITDATNKKTEAIDKSTVSVNKNKNAYDELDKIIEQLLASNEQLNKATIGEIKRQNPILDPLKPNEKYKDTSFIKPLVSPIPDNRALVDSKNIIVEYKGWMESLNREFLKFEENYGMLGGIIQGVGESIASGLDSGAQSFTGFARAAVSSLNAVIGKLVQTFVATALQANAKFMAALGPLAVPLALGTAAAAGAGAKALLGKFTAFEKGGMIYGPTLGLMGEYAGARSNPEFVGKASDIVRYIEPVVNQGGFIASTKIQGNDLMMIVERAQKKNRRVR